VTFCGGVSIGARRSRAIACSVSRSRFDYAYDLQNNTDVAAAQADGVWGWTAIHRAAAWRWTTGELADKNGRPPLVETA
jgi:hypothetical protein